MIFKALRERLRPSSGAAPTTPAGDSNRARALCAEAARLGAAGCAEDSADHYALAIAHDAQLAEAWLGYGRVMRESNNIEAAITHLEKAAALAPRCAVAWIELARAFKQAARTQDAARAYEHAIEADPEEPAAYVNFGLLCLAQLGNPARAETLLRRAVALAPDAVEAQTNLGLALHDQGRPLDAVQHFEHLIGSLPGNVEYRWHLACEQLSTGDFAHGWDGYEARKARNGALHSGLPFAEWDGKALPDGALLLRAEQGLGDEIMFSSCIADAMRVADCVIECDQRLRGLFSRSFPGALVHGVDRKSGDLSWLAKYPQIKAQCAVGSLPRFFRRTRQAFRGEGFLVADAVRVARWRERFIARGGERNIGIAWRGGTYQTRSELRSTALADWAPVFATAGTRFYALQSPTSDEVHSASALPGLHVDAAETVQDLEELAAAITALDLVISVQGTTAHLAGALGKDVWILLNANPEWRYLAHGERMPWYRSARLFRQVEPHGWQSVFHAVAAALQR